MLCRRRTSHALPTQPVILPTAKAAGATAAPSSRPPLSPDPGLRGRMVQEDWLMRPDGRRVLLAAGTPCFVRQQSGASRAEVEVFAEKPGSWLERHFLDAKFKITDRGTMASQALCLDAAATYEAVAGQLFPAAISCQDAVQGEARACALAASAAALAAMAPAEVERLLHDNGDGTVSVRLFAERGGRLQAVFYRIHKTALPASASRRQPAAWYRLLEKAVAVHGWPSSSGPPSHAQECSGGYCDRFLTLLTGRPALKRYCDFNDTSYVLSLALEIFANPSWDGRWPAVFCEAQRLALRNFVQRNPDIYRALDGRIWAVDELRSYLLETAMGPQDADALLAYCAGIVGQMQRAAAPCSEPEHLMGDVVDSALRRGKTVCLSTRPHLPKSLEPDRMSRCADVLMGLRRRGYGLSAKLGEARGGILAEHAYAIINTREINGRRQLLIVEPSATVGRKYVHRLGAQHAVATSKSIFWIDLHDLFRYTSALYFGQ